MSRQVTCRNAPRCETFAEVGWRAVCDEKSPARFGGGARVPTGSPALPYDPQLLAPHHRWLSALRRPVCQAFPHLARSPGTRAHPHLPAPPPAPAGLEEHLYPDRVCPPLSLRDHPRPPMDG